MPYVTPLPLQKKLKTQHQIIVVTILIKFIIHKHDMCSKFHAGRIVVVTQNQPLISDFWYTCDQLSWRRNGAAI